MAEKLYIQKNKWGVFTHQDIEYDLSHLDEYSFSVQNENDVERKILVTFSDHCFTRQAVDSNEPAFPNCSRVKGVFCTDRYAYSLAIREHIVRIIEGKVWMVDGDNYAIVDVVNADGVMAKYSILFSLEKAPGLPFDLVMRVKSAHLRDERDLETFGHVKFKRLVALKIKGEKPKKNWDRGRKRPK